MSLIDCLGPKTLLLTGSVGMAAALQSFVVLFLYPETKGRSIEEIQTQLGLN